MSKRRRTNLDKLIIQREFNVGTTTVDDQLSNTISFPCTFFGLHFSVHAHLTSQASSTGVLLWAIYHHRDGTNAPVLNGIGNGQLLAKGSEEMVLMSGTMSVGDIVTNQSPESHTNYHWVDKHRGEVKTKRKLQSENSIRLLLISDAVLGVRFTGHFTYWLKS